MATQQPAVCFTREVDMYPPLLRMFARWCITVAEVPFFGKRIDLLFASPSLLSLCAVETKLRDWRGAFKQAALNQLAAQRSFIALPEGLALRLRDRERDLFLRYNVGVIAVTDTARVVLPASRNGCFSLRHHRVLKHTVSRARSRRPRSLGGVVDAIANRTKAMVVLQAGAH